MATTSRWGRYRISERNARATDGPQRRLGLLSAIVSYGGLVEEK